eukprot:5284119-Alexandrium_andersonii.AAC.1
MRARRTAGKARRSRTARGRSGASGRTVCSSRALRRCASASGRRGVAVRRQCIFVVRNTQG